VLPFTCLHLCLTWLTPLGVESPVNLAFIDVGFALESPVDLPLSNEAIRALIQERLRDGRLPYDGVTRTWSGPSARETCDGCELVLASEHALMNVTTLTRGTRPLQFHPICFEVWNTERRASS
jgi:hypothetical protein